MLHGSRDGSVLLLVLHLSVFLSYTLTHFQLSKYILAYYYYHKQSLNLCPFALYPTTAVTCWTGQLEMEASASLVHKTCSNYYHNFLSDRSGGHVKSALRKGSNSASFAFPRSCYHICDPISKLQPLGILGRIHVSSAQTPTNNDVYDDSVCCVTDSEPQPAESRPVKILSIVGEDRTSPLNSASWQEVLLHTAKRMKWVDEGFEMHVFPDTICSSSNEAAENLKRELSHADILLIVAVTRQESIEWIQKHADIVPNVICFESSTARLNKLGGSYINSETKDNMLNKLAGSLLKKPKEDEKVLQTVTEAWKRYNSDDIRFCLLVIINAYIRPVPVLNNLRSKGLSTLVCMVNNCGPQILNCLLDPSCRNALQCLNKCSPVDQVCNYRCIASYESPYLEAFSLCVLQKHNCLQLDAKIPKKPQVVPMTKFRGSQLTHEIAEDLFVGWLGDLEWSWRVVAGQNPAYDQFPCQFQLFYRGKARGSFWYEPVFQVKTLDGRTVWRRRRYRVKRAKVPGTFFFSVLDNGVVSNEYWTVVDVADDLSWGLFHYHGAARVAGQSYTGAVLVSPDGGYPRDEELPMLRTSLDKCGIKEWELFKVDNCSCEDPPLGIPEGSRLHSEIVIREEEFLGSP